MDMSERLYEFLREHYYIELQKIDQLDKASLILDFKLLDMFDPVIADMLLETPDKVLPYFQETLKLFDLQTKEKINVRIRNLPERCKIRIRNLRAEHIGKLISTDVIIRSATEVKPQISEAVFQCPECDAKIVVEQTEVFGGSIQKPSSCECGRRGEFPMIDKKMVDFRMIKGTEPFEITTGEQPSELAFFLREDLTTPRMQKRTDPGSRLHIVGILREIPRRIKGKISTQLDTTMDVSHLETSEADFDELILSPEEETAIFELSKDPNVYERLKRSIAPGIYGHDEIKESLALQLFGGIPHVLPDGNRIRGNIHILLTGDPGVGKTMFLKLVSDMVPRGRYVSGSGVSGVGLTASVRKDEQLGTWVLEAGALILCNKGLIAIDEFDKMSKDDQIAMHEATSVETVSIAKASIIATLPAQTAVLAGANPQLGRFDQYKSITEQLNIPETLLSRFDLKFALKDQPNKEYDQSIADHIFQSRSSPVTVIPEINKNLIRKYVAYTKRINDIEIDSEAAERMKNFYVQMRSSTGGETVPITLRQCEALIRLAEASAKIRLDTKVRLDDANRAIRLMEFSLKQLGYDYETGRFDIDQMESGVTTAQRSKFRQIQEIVETLQKQLGKDVPRQDILAEAETQGIPKAEDVIGKLLKEGLLFEPRPGFLRRV
ncbi:MAG: minichromosome maintenance protein MCM [Candidatus Aenigmatarchaeota archaeon]